MTDHNIAVENFYHLHDDGKNNYVTGFEEVCEYKRTQLIDKACEWLRDHVLEYFDDAGVDMSTFTENFISAMKEE